MKKLKSILLAVIITMMSAGACITTAYAASDSPTPVKGGIPISPFYTYADVVSTNLSISGTTATAYASLDGNRNTKSVSVVYKLQEKSGRSWSTVETWTDSVSGRFLNSDGTYSSLTKGAQYRVYAVFTVTGTDGGKETITDYSGTYTC